MWKRFTAFALASALGVGCGPAEEGEMAGVDQPSEIEARLAQYVSENLSLAYPT